MRNSPPAPRADSIFHLQRPPHTPPLWCSSARRVVVFLLLLSSCSPLVRSFAPVRPLSSSASSSSSSLCRFPLKSPALLLLRAEKAQVRFSTETLQRTKNPVDAVLSWIVSDVGSLILGTVGLVALGVGRWILSTTSAAADNSIPDPAETRENLLIVLAIGGVMLNGLTQLDVESATAPTVELEGSNRSSMTNDDDPAQAWVLQALVRQSVISTAVLLERDASASWKVVGYNGMVPSRAVTAPSGPTPLLDKALAAGQEGSSSRRETSLPTLQALPSKQELVNLVLPSNTQAALLVPYSSNGLLVFGSNRARSFTPKDIAWCIAAASRLG